MGLKKFLIQGILLGAIGLPTLANDTQTKQDSIYEDKKRNIVVSRTKEEESLYLKQDVEIADSLESLSLGDVIVVDDSPKKPVTPTTDTTNTTQTVVCKPKIISENGKIVKVPNTAPNCGEDTTKPSQPVDTQVVDSKIVKPVPKPETPPETNEKTPSVAQKTPAPDSLSQTTEQKTYPKSSEQDTQQKTVQKPSAETPPVEKQDSPTSQGNAGQGNQETPPVEKQDSPTDTPSQAPQQQQDIVIEDITPKKPVQPDTAGAEKPSEQLAEQGGDEQIITEEVVVNLETHEQLVARLADESDFFYTFGDTHKVFYPLPNPLPKPEPKITLLQADTVGLYSPKTNGITANYWQDYDYVKVLNALQQADSGSNSYVYNQVMNRVVLSGTPVPKTKKQAGDIFAFRLQALMNAGRLFEAQKLLDTIPYDMRVTRYADTLAQIHIAYFDNASLCGLWHMQSDKVKKQAFWERTHILCLTLDGNWKGVQQAFKSAQNPMPEGFKALVEFGLKGIDIPSDTNIDINIWTVHLMRALGFGVDVPVDADMASYYGLLQNLAVPDDQRAYYAYELFKQRSLPASFVGTVYETVAPYESPLVGMEGMPFDVAVALYYENRLHATIPYHVRAVAYQQVLDILQHDISIPNANTNALIRLVLQQIDREQEYTNRMTTVRLFAPFLTEIPAYKHPESKRIAGILYASGQYQSAEKWAENNPMELWYERMLYQILQSSPDTNHNVKVYTKNKGGCGDTPINPRAWMTYISETDPNNAVYRISEAFMTLESLGCQVGNAYWQQLADMTPLLVQDIIAPAHMRSLRVKYGRAKQALPVLFAIKMFVERVDISHMEMAKVYTMLYDMGYAKLAAEIAYERNTYNPW